jgi:hypothetical protein
VAEKIEKPKRIDRAIESSHDLEKISVIRSADFLNCESAFFNPLAYGVRETRVFRGCQRGAHPTSLHCTPVLISPLPSGFMVHTSA